MSRHVALLRGINVGGHNMIPMAALRTRFEALGFADVSTYIQSGNVLFTGRQEAREKLTARIERALSAAFGYESRVVVVSAQELGRVVEEAPAGFGTEPEEYRYDVLFVKPPLQASEAMGEVELEAGVDEAHAGTHAIYYRRLISRSKRSQLDRLLRRPIGRNLTVRNWNTTTKLLSQLQLRPIA
jgi:uncharacterized protein (DUF1697 family)